ncbi:MAG: hypothetical protein RL748_3522 [Pseudomonadota bacterium]|jgi:hypothetical protein
MTDIKLNFINHSNDANASRVVIFQKNLADTGNELAVAWQVIENGGMGDNHPFTYPMSMQVGASDSWGNFTPKLEANPGQQFQLAQTTSGTRLSYSGAATSASETQVVNQLASGAINASIYRDGKLLATKTSLSPGQIAAFRFNPTIWIGVVSQVNQGDVMDSAIIANVNTQLSLLGVSSADIVMTGGGPGLSGTPFQFTLENVVMA